MIFYIFSLTRSVYAFLLVTTLSMHQSRARAEFEAGGSTSPLRGSAMKRTDSFRSGGGFGLTRRDFLAAAGLAGSCLGPEKLLASRADAAGGGALNDWAIVVGIDQTTNADPLPNSVNSAVRFTNWLIDQRHADPGRIFLLTSPFPAAPKAPQNGGPAPKVPAGINTDEAKLDNLVDTVQNVAGKPVAPARLLFFFSGHGIAFQPQPGRGFAIDTQDGLLPGDFKPGTRKALSLYWILKYLQSTPFVEQFYFLDACRKVQHTDSPHEGSLNFPQTQPLGQETTFYILYATPPGHETIATTSGFPDSLLDGLAGTPGAIKYDSGKDRYLVRWDGLNLYLQQFFADPANPVVRKGIHGEIIEPMPFVWPGWNLLDSPVLAEIDPTVVKYVNLTLTITPSTVLGGAQILISGPKVVKQQPPPAVVAPISFHLPPRDYIITVLAGGQFFQGTIPLTADKTLSIPFSSGPMTPSAGGPLIAAQSPPSSDSGGTLTLSSLDPLATVELADCSGALVRARRRSTARRARVLADRRPQEGSLSGPPANRGRRGRGDDRGDRHFIGRAFPARRPGGPGPSPSSLAARDGRHPGERCRP